LHGICPWSGNLGFVRPTRHGSRGATKPGCWDFFTEFREPKQGLNSGYIDTPPWHATEAGEQLFKTVSNGVPLGRVGTADEIAKAVVFLASNDSSYITGVELFVDGGVAQI
jgi:Enoyl-(Acyl carrier protein) reductase